MDNWNNNPSGDLAAMEWRLRGFNVEFGALDFLPQGATVKAGLFGLSQGWDDMQDFGPGPNFSGIGTGITGLGGMVSVYYMAQDATDSLGGQGDAPNISGGKIGERTMHSFVMTVSHPMVDVIAGVGFAKKGKDAFVNALADDADDDDTAAAVARDKKEKNLVAFAAGAIIKLPVGLNVFAQVGTNNWATQMVDNFADDTVLKGCDFTPSATEGQDKIYKALTAKVGFYAVMDLGDGMYVAPAAFYQYFKTGKDYDISKNMPSWVEGYAPDTAHSLVNATVKFSKALTQNIAFAPQLGYHRNWTDASGDKAHTLIQATAGVEMGLNTGYWAGQKVQVYVSYNRTDKDNKFYNDKQNKVVAGTYVTFGF